MQLRQPGTGWQNASIGDSAGPVLDSVTARELSAVFRSLCAVQEMQESIEA